MDPNFPDIVGEWARHGLNDNEPAERGRNSERVKPVSAPVPFDDELPGLFDPQDLTWLGSLLPRGNIADPFTAFAAREIARTRDW
jgi:hypothetical protein